MSHASAILLFAVTSLNLSSCFNQSPPKLIEKPAQDQLIGRVSSIYESSNYLLVQKYRRFDPSEDAVFYTRNADGATYSIKMTSQRLGQFYVADIESGNFDINDPVFMRDLSRKVFQAANTKTPTNPPTESPNE